VAAWTVALLGWATWGGAVLVALLGTWAARRGRKRR
jgi:hypothetical protein